VLGYGVGGGRSYIWGWWLGGRGKSFGRRERGRKKMKIQQTNPRCFRFGFFVFKIEKLVNPD
jgi:hypothetical protein